MRPSNEASSARIDTPIIRGISKRTSRRETVNGRSKAAKPRTKSMLAMLLPTTLPMFNAEWSERSAVSPTASSGEPVPQATTVKPTTNDETPNVRASCAAPRTSSSAPPSIMASPPTNNARVIEVNVSLEMLTVCSSPAFFLVAPIFGSRPE